MGYLVVFGFFRSRPKMNFLLCFIFRFRSKMSFALGRKCYVRKLTITKFCDIGTGNFRFRSKMEFHFRRHFRLRPKMKNASSDDLYIKLFQITPYVNDFQTFNNPGSGQPVGASKN